MSTSDDVRPALGPKSGTALPTRDGEVVEMDDESIGTDPIEAARCAIRSALFDEALASGLKQRIAEMRERLEPVRGGCREEAVLGCDHHAAVRAAKDQGAGFHRLTQAGAATRDYSR